MKNGCFEIHKIGPYERSGSHNKKTSQKGRGNKKPKVIGFL